MMIVEADVGAPIGRAALKGMFEARKQVFVDLLKWDVPVIDGRFEVDEFDTPAARYLLVTDREGTHLGSARLLPTSRPHILGSLFGTLCAGPVPTGPAIAEITRFCLGRNQTSVERRLTRNRLVSALVRDAQKRGIKTYTGVAEISWLQQILAFGWHCRPLGPPKVIGRSMLGALAIEIDGGTPALLAANGIWTEESLEPALVEEAA